MPIVAAYNNKQRQEQARCACDKCSREIFITCKHGHRPNHKSDITSQQISNIQTVHQQLKRFDWKIYGKKLTCDQCVALKKESKLQKKINNVTVMREPTRAQKRAITQLLEDVYDVDRGCYTKAETDKTVANVLGDGILFGWVAQIREDMFGPDGNENDQLSIGEAHLWVDKADKQIKAFEAQVAALNKTLDEYKKCKSEVRNFLDKIERMAG